MSDIRKYVELIESAQSYQPINQIDNLKDQYKNKSPQYFIELSGNYDTPESFANEILNNEYTDNDYNNVINRWLKLDKADMRGEKEEVIPENKLIKHIAKHINAIDYKKVNKPEWGNEMIYGSGFILYTDSNAVYSDLVEHNGTLMLSQISVKERGDGLGNTFMQSLKEYADTFNKDIEIMKVTNTTFFSKFKWLARTHKYSFKYHQ